ncbi:MAG: cell envelope biogenesis protein TolA [Synergistaceae bacterium]|jgi:vacuolar-type H+-ATPase subunit H|nr:cell envelope biogenesis protein TolA [Synergistaceae bacterium]
MAANLVDEIKAAEEKSANSVREAGANAAKRLNQAVANAENSVKEARQSAAKQFRENIQTAEKKAEEKARGIVSAREAASKTFYTQNKEKVSKAAAWITEEVMARYGRG